MKIDFAQLEAASRDQPFRSQVCIVGGGIAGLLLAHALVDKGLEVALLEAGGLLADPASDAVFRSVVSTSQPHAATLEGRTRALGGSSVTWGGQLLASALEGWPLSAKDLRPFVHAAQKLFSVDDLPFLAANFFERTRQSKPALLTAIPGLEASLSKWIPFRARNLAATLGRELLASQRAQVFLHAQATELLLQPGSAAGVPDRIAAVLVRGPGERTHRFEADHYVIAAGTVESARLLLASRSGHPAGVGNAHDQVGRGFHDHLTLTAAAVTGAARDQFLQDLSPWIYGDAVHTPKLCTAPELEQRLSLLPALAHLTIEEPEGSGLAALREVLHERQESGSLLPTLRQHAGQLPSAALDGLRVMATGKLQHRRYVSPAAKLTLHLNTAQLPSTHSRITLSAEKDAAGMPQPSIDWKIDDAEVASLQRFAGYLREQLAGRGLDASTGLDWIPELFREGTPLPGLSDARHPMGGALLNVDPRSGVVDLQLTVHGVQNLSVASCAVFPDGRPHLPTLTLAALTLRLAEHLAESLASR